jgi:peptide/nickel transport system ATP-binding protein
MQAIFSVEELHTVFRTKQGPLRAVDNVSFSLQAGKILGIVGESGSGKTVTALSLLRLIQPPGEVVAGRVLFHGQDLLALSPEEMRRIRGKHIGMVFQDPMASLNPVLRIDTQIIEAIQAHEAMPTNNARRRAREALARVGISAPEQRLHAYPHQLSGGMRQRVAIAIAMLHQPEILIADEPTTALDVTIQAQILYEMRQLCSRSSTAVIWITHDLAVVAGLTDHICVMYAGQIVETGTVDEILDKPQHPYTRGLIESVPAKGRRGDSLNQIPGMAPSLVDLDGGCRFKPRCGRATERCLARPLLEPSGPGHHVRCFHPIETSA